jgi:Arc/MetJ-type ribon-helix-helix transcriptional regulator
VSQSEGRASPPTTADERVTLRVGDDLLAEVDQLVEDGEYDSRSDVFRSGAEVLTGGELS